MAADDEVSATRKDRPSPRLERWLFPVVFVGGTAMLIHSMFLADLRLVGFHIGFLIVFAWVHFNRWVLHLAFGSPAFRLDRIEKPELLIAGGIIAFGSIFTL